VAAFMGYGGACPDYTVGDARFVFWLRHSSFHFNVTLTVTDFRIPELGRRVSSP